MIDLKSNFWILKIIVCALYLLIIEFSGSRTHRHKLFCDSKINSGEHIKKPFLKIIAENMTFPAIILW